MAEKPKDPVVVTDTSVSVPALGFETTVWVQYTPRPPRGIDWKKELPEEHEKAQAACNRNMPEYWGVDDMIEAEMFGLGPRSTEPSEFVVSMYMERAYGAQLIAALTGYGPKKLRKMVQGALNRKWFINPWTNLLARTAKNTWSVRMVHQIVANQYLIPQYEADGQANLIPLALVSGLDSYRLRHHVGKGTWKRLVHNSVTRNTLIARRWVQSFGRDVNPESLPIIHSLARTPSTLLRSRYRGESFPALASRIRPYKELVHNDGRLLYMLNDIARASNRRPRSPEDIERIHMELFVPIRGRRQSAEPKLPPLDVPPLEGVLKNGVEYKLLRTQEEYLEEGEQMHHCVGAYYRDAYNNSYHVMSLSGTVKATIGFRMGVRNGQLFDTMDDAIAAQDALTSETIDTLAVDQCFGPCNKAVPNRADFETKLKKLLVDHLQAAIAQQQQAAA